MPANLRPIVILGPTAGGKSELAAAVAESCRPRGEIINADSMQVYRGMEAGTAKPPESLRRRVVHHLIDIVEPTERFTVADWLARSEPLIGELQGRGVRPVIVGGTNLYLKALLEGMFAGPEGDASLRAELMKLTGAELHHRLQGVDPAAAERIHPHDIKKLVRAIEVYELTGKPISEWQTQWGRSNQATQAPRDQGPEIPVIPSTSYRHCPILIGLDWPVEAINRRINARVKAMFHPEASGLTCESLPEETRRLEAAGLLGPQAREALGYKQVLEHLARRCTLEEAFEKTKVLTRRFAKTQRTWLKRYVGVHWLPVAEQSETDLARAAVSFVTSLTNTSCI